ncbi:ABC transporter permease [Dactylosporangium sp. CA-092794]|uniref:ABC transporter permease n=1 Tax=Dactylosporangium sp. CA-092794 TaxID=3239929 RepID=UPI003D8DA726
MARYITMRLLSVVPILFLVSIFTFALITFVPGDKALAIAGVTASPEDIARIRTQYHLDQPVYVQYWYWLEGVLHFDLGDSRYNGQSVAGQIETRLPVTLSLVILASVIALAFGVVLGLIAGIRRRRAVDNVTNIASGVLLALPSFVVALVLLLVLGVRLGWLPILGYTNFADSPWDWLQHMIMPALALAGHIGAIVYRQLRASVGDTLGARFVTAAWARGGSPRGVVGKHVLRNASGPALTSFGVQIAYVIGGTVIVEQIFSVPGMGPYLLAAIKGNDLPVIQGGILTFVLCQAVFAMLVDITHGFLNPKLRVAS